MIQQQFSKGRRSGQTKERTTRTCNAHTFKQLRMHKIEDEQNYGETSMHRGGEKAVLPETLEAMDIKTVIHSFTASRSRTG